MMPPVNLTDGAGGRVAPPLDFSSLLALEPHGPDTFVGLSPPYTWGRIYGGGGYLVDRDPETLGRKYAQLGAELKGPLMLDCMRLIAGGYFQRRETSDYRTDYSARAGIQFEGRRTGGRRLQLMAEYYKGQNPNGQFFSRRIEYLGAGVHFHF